MERFTHGGKRKFSGRTYQNPVLAVEKRRVDYEKEYPHKTKEEIKNMIKADAVRLTHPDWFKYLDSEQYGSGVGATERELKDKVLKLIEEGCNYSEIAEKLGYKNYDSMHMKAKKLGIKKYKKWNELDYEKILELKAEGVADHSIAKSMGCCAQLAKKALTENGYYKAPSWEEIFDNGSLCTSGHHRGSIRNMISYKNRKYLLSRVVWNLHNPEDQIKEGEIIHHIDGNELDDSIENLQKMTRKDHKRLHLASKNAINSSSIRKNTMT